jgi:3-oxoacyl-[acyl-carrier protein] reductase
MDLELAGKQALITGASKGIGFAVAQKLAGEGCHVTLAARNADALEAAQRQLRQAYPGVRVEVHAADLSQTAEQERLAQLGRDADVFVNNAGSNPGGDLLDTTDPVWRAAFDLKLFGYINLTRMMVGAMKARGRGVVVNVIGFAGERLMSQYIVGSTANAGLIGFTRSVGSRSPDFGVRVVGVNPSLTATDRATGMLKTWSKMKFGTEDRWQEVESGMNLPFGRMASSDEVADAVLFLASARASYISGVVLNVDGGAAFRNV